jgi:FKBP-type peptidyl-prolyl cis-trans isomerase
MREILMSAANWHRVLCCAALLLLLEGISGCAQSKDVVVLAHPTDAAKTAFPTLPAGAGAIAKDAPTQFSQTASGLRYRMLRTGNGQMPRATDTVKVNYHGWLDGGKVFDSSYERNKPISFPLNGVIKGWTEGMQLVREGGMIELEVPSSLGYGDRGMPGAIPGGATLHFLVELLKIE